MVVVLSQNLVSLWVLSYSETCYLFGYSAVLYDALLRSLLFRLYTTTQVNTVLMYLYVVSYEAYLLSPDLNGLYCVFKFLLIGSVEMRPLL